MFPFFAWSSSSKFSPWKCVFWKSISGRRLHWKLEANFHVRSELESNLFFLCHQQFFSSVLIKRNMNIPSKLSRQIILQFQHSLAWKQPQRLSNSLCALVVPECFSPVSENTPRCWYSVYSWLQKRACQSSRQSINRVNHINQQWVM